MPNETTHRVTLALDGSTADLLERAGGERGRGDYVQALVADAWRDWTESLDLLTREHSWAPQEILAACDALNGYWQLGRRPIGSWLALELHDDARLNGSVDKWGLDGDHYRARVEDLAGSDEIAYHLAIVTREFWRGNREVEARLRSAEAAG